jgi:histidine triad (HIT) family protein
MSTDCIFCKIVQGIIPATKVYEDDTILAFNDIHPKASVHILVIPKVHIANLNDLTTDNSALISHMVLSLPKIAEQQGLTGFRVIVNNGPEGGQEVPHLHFHILGGQRLPRF